MHLFPLKLHIHTHKHTHNFIIKLQVQLANSQWLLTVELHQFQNLYNAEIIPGEGLCCCDTIRTNNVNCKQNLTDFPKCGRNCDTSFSISLFPCYSSYSCLASIARECQSDSVLNLDYALVFLLTNFSNKVNWCLLSAT